MSSRTKMIIEMAKQQASLDTFEYIVGQDGILSPTNSSIPCNISENPLNVDEAPLRINTDFLNDNMLGSSSTSTLDNIEFPAILNCSDDEKVNKDLGKDQISETAPNTKNVCNITTISAENDVLDVLYIPKHHDMDSSIGPTNNDIREGDSDDRDNAYLPEKNGFDDHNSSIIQTNVHPEDVASDSDNSYVPEENDSVNNNENNFIEDHNEPSVDIGLPTRNRQKRRNSDGWNSNANKYKRSKGLPYQGKKKTESTWDYKINKPGKFLTQPCNCALSKKKSSLQCQTLTEEKRLKIFQVFWHKLSWSERKVQVQALVQCENVKRRRGQQDVVKRNYSMKYFFKMHLENVRVCKRMFNGTLGLKETMVLSWVKEGANNSNGENDFGAIQPNRKSETRKAKFAERNEAVYQFLQTLPKLESHYCRSSSKKLYLEPLWRSKAELYKFFKTNYCAERHLEAASITAFVRIFEELNLALYMPKKDLCDTCEAYKTKNLSEEAYNLHQRLKEEARQEKEKDKSNDDSTVKVYTMDLQSVLLSPKSTVSSMYYKTKLIVHNFTIFNLKTKDGFCFVWNESEGGLTANEFSSILSNFVEEEIQKSDGHLSEMIFFSDGCTGQNRNSTLANAFVNLAAQHNIIITQKYLLKGHTQMEVDSMHSAIERQIRDRKINVPADYVFYCQKARSIPSPYNAEYITHTFFKNFDGLKFYSSIRPGRTVGDPVVTDLKALRYLPNYEIQFKLRLTDPWDVLNQRFNKKIRPCKFKELPRLFTARRKIKKEKYDHLQLLKLSILQDYHKFYDDLLYE